MDKISIPLRNQNGKTFKVERKHSIQIEYGNKFLKLKQSNLGQNSIRDTLDASKRVKEKGTLPRRNKLEWHFRDAIQNLRSPLPTAKTRSIGVQSSIDKLSKQYEMKSSLSGIDFTIEKFSSEHKFTCTSPRFSYNDQTKLRPRMRTIGLQKNSYCDVREKSLNTSTGADGDGKKSTFQFPLNICSYDYIVRNPEPIDVYHHCQCPQNVACGHWCNCGRYHNNKIIVKPNGVYNQRLYMEQNISPDRGEYRYSCDEYYYECPCARMAYNSKSEQHKPSIAMPSPPISTFQTSPPIYCRCSQLRKQEQPTNTYYRRSSDLNTNEFFHSKRGAITTKPRKPLKDTKMMEKYMLSLLKNSRKYEKVRKGNAPNSKQQNKNNQIDGEKRKSSQKHDLKKTLLRLQKVEQVAKMFKQKMQKHPNDDNYVSSQSSDDKTSLSEYKITSKEKLLKISLKKNPLSGDAYTDSSEVEYPSDTLKTLKHMRITPYTSRTHKLRNDKNEKRSTDDTEEEEKVYQQPQTRIGSAKIQETSKNNMSHKVQNQYKNDVHNNQFEPTLTNRVESQQVDNDDHVQTVSPLQNEKKRELHTNDIESGLNKLDIIPKQITDDTNRGSQVYAEDTVHELNDQEKDIEDRVLIQSQNERARKEKEDRVLIQSQLQNERAQQLNSNRKPYDVESPVSQIDYNSQEYQSMARIQNKINKYYDTPSANSNIKANDKENKNSSLLNASNSEERGKQSSSLLTELKSNHIQTNSLPENTDTKTTYNKSTFDQNKKYDNSSKLRDGHTNESKTDSLQMPKIDIHSYNTINSSSNPNIPSVVSMDKHVIDYNSTMEQIEIVLNKTAASEPNKESIPTYNTKPTISKMPIGDNAFVNNKSESMNFEKISSGSRIISHTSNISLVSWGSCCSCFEDEQSICTQQVSKFTIPEFSGCSCMRDIYLQMLSIYCANDMVNECVNETNLSD